MLPFNYADVPRLCFFRRFFKLHLYYSTVEDSEKTKTHPLGESAAAESKRSVKAQLSKMDSSSLSIKV